MKKLIYGMVALLLTMSTQWGCVPPVFTCDNGICPGSETCASSPSGKKLCYPKCQEKGQESGCHPDIDQKGKLLEKTDCVCTPHSTAQGEKGQLIFYPCAAYKEETCNGKDDDCDGLMDNPEEGKSLCPKGQECKAGKCECSGNNQTFCGNECVATANDRRHCGGCGNECKQGELCGNGKCAVDCPTGQSVCNGTCVELASSVQHCGGCGKTCIQGQECKGGKCECPGNKPTLCGNECVVMSNDPKHCGGCGNVCKQGEVCGNGKCSVDCPGGQTVCGGTCVVLASDPQHCGQCGKACPQGHSCRDSLCRECTTNDTRPCGNFDKGVCRRGTQTCDVNGRWGTQCVGEVMPTKEICNGKDDDCDGEVDEGNVCAFQWGAFTSTTIGVTGTVVSANDQGIYGAGAYYGGMVSLGSASGSTVFEPSDNDTEAAVFKLNHDHSVDWAFSLGSANHDIIYAMAQDRNGNLYLTGYYTIELKMGPRKPTTEVSPSLKGRDGKGYEMFVLKLSPTGTVLWANTARGDGNEEAQTIVVTPDGARVCVASSFRGRVEVGLTNPKTIGDINSKGKWLFIMCMNGQTGDRIWLAEVGAETETGATSISIQPQTLEVFVTGYMEKQASFGSIAVNIPNNSTARTAFWGKLDRDGNWKWAKAGGGLGSEPFGILALPVNNGTEIYVTGRCKKGETFGGFTITDSGQDNPSNYTRFLVMRVSDSDGSVVWAKGSSKMDGSAAGNVLTVDQQGNLYVSGKYEKQPNFGASRFTLGSFDVGEEGTFVSRFNASGDFLSLLMIKGKVWSNAMAVHDSTVYVSGYFQGDAVMGSTKLSTTNRDGFIWKIPKDCLSGQVPSGVKCPN